MPFVNSPASALFIDWAMDTIDQFILLTEIAAALYFTIAAVAFIAKRIRATTTHSEATADSLAKPPQSRIVPPEMPAISAETTVDEQVAESPAVEPEPSIEPPAEPIVELPAASIKPIDQVPDAPVAHEPKASTPRHRSSKCKTKGYATATAGTAAHPSQSSKSRGSRNPS